MRIVRVLVYEGPEEWLYGTWKGGFTPWIGQITPTKWASISSTVITGRDIVETWMSDAEAKLTAQELEKAHHEDR